MQDPQIGFVGAGRMATALARGMIDAGLVRPEHVTAADPSETAANEFARVTGADWAATNRLVAETCNVLILAVKPQHMSAALAQLQGHISPKHLVVSVAAGVPLATIEASLGPGPRYARAMPNAPALVGQGASAYCLGAGASETDAALVERLLSSVGSAIRIEERLMDAVTGLSGSGPAFVFVMIEALSDGGVRMGQPRP
jgi:pyrroline-5-carboxylate reductase